MNQLIIGNSLACLVLRQQELYTSNEATLEGYAINHVFDHCDSIMKNVINKKTKTKRQWLIIDLLILLIKNMLQYLYILNLKKFLMADRKFKCKFGHMVIMNCFSLKAKNAMISRTSKLLEIYDLDGLEP